MMRLFPKVFSKEFSPMVTFYARAVKTEHCLVKSQFSAFKYCRTSFLKKVASSL